MDTSRSAENDAYLAPYIETRNELAHQTLAAMLDGNYTTAQLLMEEYTVAKFHCDTITAMLDAMDWAATQEHENGPKSK
jgi:hypothetical protein